MKKHKHYFRPCPYNEIDIYRVCNLFEVNDQSGAKQHAIKKILMAWHRGGKDEYKDMQEAADTINRWLDMHIEDLSIK